MIGRRVIRVIRLVALNDAKFRFAASSLELPVLARRICRSAALRRPFVQHATPSVWREEIKKCHDADYDRRNEQRSRIVQNANDDQHEYNKRPNLIFIHRYHLLRSSLSFLSFIIIERSVQRQMFSALAFDPY